MKTPNGGTEVRNLATRARIVGAIIIALLLGGATTALGVIGIPDADGRIYGCYENKSGELRLVPAGEQCAKNETSIYWNQTGPVGPTGPQGAKGDTGAAGAQGPAGPAGAGLTSLDSLNGLPCNTSATAGTTRVTYGLSGAVTIVCEIPIPPTGNPVFTGLSVSGSIASAQFSKPVCRMAPWTPTDWQVSVNGFPATAIGDSVPFCTAAADNGVAIANISIIVPAPEGSFVTVTLTASGGSVLRDSVGNQASAPQTRTATATAPESTAPTIGSVAASVGSMTFTITFSEPVYCTGFSFDSTDILLTDDNTATTDPVVVSMGSNSCGFTPVSADSSFSVNVNSPFPSARTYTLVLLPEANEIQDVVGNDVRAPTTATFTTPPADVTPPTLVDAIMVNNLQTTDLADVGDAFSITFSEPMIPSAIAVQIQDLDGTLATVECSGFRASCVWNTAVTNIVVTLTAPLLIPAPGSPDSGTTPGMQIPATITQLIGFSDLQGNVPNLAGSLDRLIDFE